MTDSAAKPPREFTKVDRALEMQVIDWLQWDEFKEKLGGPDYPALALELIAKRKAYTEALLAERDELKKCEFAWEQTRRENERLEKWLAKGRYSIEQEAAVLEKEREQLRARCERLEHIIRDGMAMNGSGRWLKEARAALAPESGGGGEYAPIHL